MGNTSIVRMIKAAMVKTEGNRIVTEMEDVPFDELFDEDTMKMMDNIALYVFKGTSHVKYGSQMWFIRRIVEVLDKMFVLDDLKIGGMYSDSETSESFIEVKYDSAIWCYNRNSGLRW